MEKYYELFDEGMLKLETSGELEAMFVFEKAEKLRSTPRVRSYLAYCRAKVKREFYSAIQDCTDALNEEPTNPDHYLNLGRIYLLADKRGPAIQLFRKGIKLGPHPKLMQELRNFELRKTPVFARLPREHFINRQFGWMLSRIGLR